MIKLSSPDINDQDILRVIEVLKNENLVQGTNVNTLENKLSSFTKIPNCVVVSSCTAALHLAILALGITKGDSVIIPAFTFPATANVVELSGANIILSDVDRDSYVVNPKDIERVIIKNKNKNIKAVIIVHEFGYPVEIKEIEKITNKYNLMLIEDAACALGTIADKHHPGFYSDLACFSLHPRKAITTGEGGAILTKSSYIAKKFKILRNHGIFKMKNGFDFISAGLNYRMTDFQAALAIGQLDRFSEELEKRKKIITQYYEMLSEIKLITLPKYHSCHSWQSFMVLLRRTIDRKKIIDQMLKHGIQTNIGAYAINCLSYYQKKYCFRANEYNNATELFKKGLVLPLHGKLTSKDLIYIVDCLKKVLD